MILRRVHPANPGDDTVAIADPDARARLAEWYRPPRADWLRLNLIASVGGSAAGSDGTSESLTNPADRMLLGAIRDLADVVLVGASTVRAEGYFVPRTAALAIVTACGDLTGHRITQKPGRGEIVVLCPVGSESKVAETTSGLDATIVGVDDVVGHGIRSSSIVDGLRDRGFASIVCEGGPTLAARLIADRLVDELCLSTSARLSPRALPLFSGTPLPESELVLHQLLLDDASGLYARWLFPA